MLRREERGREVGAQQPHRPKHQLTAETPLTEILISVTSASVFITWLKKESGRKEGCSCKSGRIKEIQGSLICVCVCGRERERDELLFL